MDGHSPKMSQINVVILELCRNQRNQETSPSAVDACDRISAPMSKRFQRLECCDHFKPQDLYVHFYGNTGGSIPR